MTAGELAKLLAKNAEAFCKDLFPAGSYTVKGGSFEVGDVLGNKGVSLRVKLNGEKAGVWKDFAGTEKGDLIGLIKEVKNYTVREAYAYGCKWLNIDPQSEYRALSKDKPRKQYLRSVLPQKSSAPKAVHEYLTEQRKILPETLRMFKICGEGNNIKFPFIVDEECFFIKSISIYLNEKGKKIISVEPKDAEQCLFGWQALDGSEREIVICEGELDCLSLWQYGYKALSVPFGAKSFHWINVDFERLSIFDTIYVLMDMDEVGQSAAREIIQRLGEERCKLVKLPKKDANECLQAGIVKEDIDACFKAAQYQDPLELKMADEFMEEAYLILHPELQKDVGIKLDLGRGEVIFRPDETTIWSGINGQGKSMVLGQVLLDTIKQGKKVCIASLEVKPSRTLARMLRQVCGCKSPERNLYLDAREWLYNKLWIFDFVGEVSHAKLLQIFEYAYKRYGVDIFLIDSLMMLDIREDKIEEQKKFAQKVCSFARKFGVHVHLVAHPRKQQSEENMPNKMDISGSGMITNAVENVLIVWRNKVKETILDKYNTGQITFGDEEYKKVEKARKSPDSCVICVKNKNGDWEGIIPLSFHRDSYQFLPSPSHELKKYIEPTESGKEWFEE